MLLNGIVTVIFIHVQVLYPDLFYVVIILSICQPVAMENVRSKFVSVTRNGTSFQIVQGVSNVFYMSLIYQGVSLMVLANLYDCLNAERCPLGSAWADKAYAPNKAHSLRECSGQGICNRPTVRHIATFFCGSS